MTESAPRILVADDDEDILAFTALKLRRAGYEVVEATDGPSALDGIREVRPDLAVLDITMPGKSGLDVLREIRCDPDVSTMRVVLLTGHARGSERLAGLDAGADEYVLKPFSGADLIDAVGRVLEL